MGTLDAKVRKGRNEIGGFLEFLLPSTRVENLLP